jgi:hypothetical protein
MWGSTLPVVSTESIATTRIRTNLESFSLRLPRKRPRSPNTVRCSSFIGEPENHPDEGREVPLALPISLRERKVFDPPWADHPRCASRRNKDSNTAGLRPNRRSGDSEEAAVLVGIAKREGVAPTGAIHQIARDLQADKDFAHSRDVVADLLWEEGRIRPGVPHDL